MAGHRNFAGWITDKYIYAMLLIYPLFWGFRGYSHITASKFAFFAGITVIWLLLLTISIVNNRLLRGGRFSVPQALMLLFFAACCVSAAFSIDFVSSLLGKGRFDGLLTIFLSAAIFLGVSAFARPKTGYIYALALSMTICCAVAVVQLLGYNALGLFPNDYNYYDGGFKFSGEFLGTIGNADLFSAFLCLCLPLFCSYYITAEKPPVRLLPAVLIGIFCAFACRVSAGKLALGLTLLVAAPLLITDAKRLRRLLEVLAIICLGLFAASCFTVDHGYEYVDVSFRFSKISAVLLTASAAALALRLLLGKFHAEKRALRIFFTTVSVVAVAAGLVAAYNWQGTEGTIYELSRVLHGEVHDSFGSSRIRIWRNTLELVKDRPMLGGGPGTLPLRLEVDFSRYVAESGKTFTAHVDNAHNVYLGILANTGAVSLLLYLSAMVSSLVYGIKKHHTAALCIACPLICYWIQDFFGLGLFIVSPIMFIFWGLLASRGKILCKPAEVTDNNDGDNQDKNE